MPLVSLWQGTFVIYTFLEVTPCRFFTTYKLNNQPGKESVLVLCGTGLSHSRIRSVT